ncbi:MAG TPA: glucosaminidase domain-containing protein, partial [Trichococcus sp.]|nr:glucosaminidase domain-containing protein [Trichococcus sp.]
MKIVQKKYLRTYITLSSMAASLLVGNKLAFAEEGDGTNVASAPIESTNPVLPVQQADEPPVSAELPTEEETEVAMPMPVVITLDEGVYGTNQISGTTEPNAYVLVCAEESKIGEQTADEAGIFTVALESVPEGTTVLQVKVYKDATQTFLLSESDWLVPVAEGTEEGTVVDAEDPQAIPSEPSSPVGEEPVTDSGPEVEIGTDDSNAEPIGETDPESADAEETAQAPMMTATAAAATTAAVVEEAKGTWYYYVQSGDTLLKIATHYSTDVDSLMRWNRLTSTLINIGQLLSVNGTNVYAEIDKETRTFATKAEFVNYLGQYATEIGNDYNLYASVMVAQASLETAYGTSKLSTVGNNLFGIKGSYAGNSIVMRTWEEESDGSIIWIDAFFRLYPSYYESMIDYAEKLRNGVSWDPNYYKGTWK